jgi:hypothetical protein
MHMTIRAGRYWAGMMAAAAFGGAAMISSVAAQEAQQPAPQQQQQTPRWDSLPLMKLEAFYRGPLMDTVIQRWRDPVDGTVCYIYLPISSEHAQTSSSPYVQYGANQIGSISCFAQAVAAAPSAPAAPAKPKTPVRKPRPAPAE